MSSSKKKVVYIKERPQTMIEFQALLDRNKHTLSEGDYLRLCNGMKDMFLQEEKEIINPMILVKVRIMYPEVQNRAGSQPLVLMRSKNEIINIKKEQLEKIVQGLKDNNIIHYRNNSIDSHIVIDCDSCEDENNVVISSSEYITHIYPKEQWENDSSISRQNDFSGIIYI